MAKAELPFEHRVLARSRGVRVLAYDEIGLAAPRPVSIALVPAVLGGVAVLELRRRVRVQCLCVHTSHTLKRKPRCQPSVARGALGAALRLALRAVTFHARALGQRSRC